MSVQRRSEQAVTGGERAAVFTVIEGAAIGAKLFVLEGGADVQGDGPRSLVALADGLIRAAKNSAVAAEALTAKLVGPTTSTGSENRPAGQV